jgi:predicted ribosome quality control (RQC) complex YloA/Tae2 family protein
MVGNYYTLLALTASTEPLLSGRRIVECYSQERDEAVLTFEKSDGALIVSCRSDTGTFYWTPRHARARRNSADVLRDCVGRSVAAVTIHPADRRVEFALAGGGMLVGLFHGARSNLLLCTPEGIIVDAFRDARTLEGGPLPAPRGGDPDDLAGIAAAMHAAPAEPVAALLKGRFPGLGSTLIREALFRAGILPAALTGELPREAGDRLELAVARLLLEIRAAAPRVYSGIAGTPGGLLLALAELSHLGKADYRAFQDIHEAVRHRLHRGHAGASFEQKKRALVLALERAGDRQRRKVDAMRADLDDAARADEYERYGRLLLGAGGTVPKGAASATLADDRGEVTVILDPAMSPVRNAQRWFDKAKRARASRRETTERLVRSERRLVELAARLARAESIATDEELRAFMDEQDGTPSGSNAAGADDGERLPFRVFTVEGGFQVLAGKSSANNDLLTMKHARPNDLWFHARGSSGSHVVLRVGTGNGIPGKRAKEQAAGIAAYYSRMRNASMVPVAMTEKKYVRKPKGSPPGSVVIDRERVVFATPALPEGAQEDAS